MYLIWCFATPIGFKMCAIADFNRQDAVYDERETRVSR